ncbi:hypothetical protein OPV22_024141 [Ensete ventricosum]|uniref:Tubulin-specific chaperone A n=1 Tax=Ensete ventricosum TaxID=4639 RepID=A0AAV8QYA1_ENSVE|nr:hypothetical protein OPV22_024141 [Ensete ventricosum]
MGNTNSIPEAQRTMQRQLQYCQERRTQLQWHISSLEALAWREKDEIERNMVDSSRNFSIFRDCLDELEQVESVLQHLLTKKSICEKEVARLSNELNASDPEGAARAGKHSPETSAGIRESAESAL